MIFGTNKFQSNDCKLHSYYTKLTELKNGSKSVIFTHQLVYHFSLFFVGKLTPEFVGTF